MRDDETKARQRAVEAISEVLALLIIFAFKFALWFPLIRYSLTYWARLAGL